jgi:TatD DNase family protein
MIDFHCHVDLFPEPMEIIRLAEVERTYVLSVTTTPKAWKKTAELARNSKRVRTALGLHPQIAHERHGELDLFDALLPETEYVGEVGLDGGPEYRAHADIQLKVFRRILKSSASNGGRILSIHSKHAAADVLTALRSNPNSGLPVLHWFSGSKEQMATAVDQGCWFSVGPSMLRSAKGRALASAMPRDRLLTETDGPFGTISGRALMPNDVKFAIDDLSNIWSIPKGDVVHQVEENLKKLLSVFRQKSPPDEMASHQVGQKTS